MEEMPAPWEAHLAARHSLPSACTALRSRHAIMRYAHFPRAAALITPPCHTYLPSHLTMACTAYLPTSPACTSLSSTYLLLLHNMLTLCHLCHCPTASMGTCGLGTSPVASFLHASCSSLISFSPPPGRGRMGLLDGTSKNGSGQIKTLCRTA